MTSRIAPAEPPYGETIDGILSRLMPEGMEPLLLFRVLARNRRVCERFLSGGLLDRGSISVRAREIVILRATARCGCAYEWGVHVRGFGKAAAFDAAAISASVHGDANDTAWNEDEQLLIALVDALHDTATVDADLWSALARRYTDEQLIELVMLAGSYHMVSFLTNALGLPLEGDAPDFPDAPH